MKWKVLLLLPLLLPMPVSAQMPPVITMQHAKSWGKRVGLFYCYNFKRGVKTTGEMAVATMYSDDPVVKYYSNQLFHNQRQYPKEHKAYLQALWDTVQANCPKEWDRYVIDD